MLKSVDFFCSGGGMSCGLSQASIDVIAGVDIDIKCKETYETNHGAGKFVHVDIKTLPLNYFETEEKWKNLIKINDDNLIFVGCSPCQYWSIINTDKTKPSETKDLLENFQSFVEYYKPGYVLIENVPGLFNKKNESPIDNFLQFLESNNYNYKKEILKVQEYGVPQTRKRFVLIASRVSNVKLPLPTTKETPPTVRGFIGDLSRFKPIKAGTFEQSSLDSCAGLSEIMLERLQKTPLNGGTRLAWKDDEKLQLPCYKGKDDSFKDIYGRLFWDKPSSTITTKFFSISNGRFAHPEQDRGLTLREGAALQTFPENYIFKTTTIADTARIIGNAVPPELARQLGLAIIEAHTKQLCQVSEPKRVQQTY